MSQGTYFTAKDVYISRHLFSSVEEVEEQIKDYNIYINKLKLRLYGMVCSTPRDIIPVGDEGWEPLEYVQKEFEEIVENIEEYTYIIYKLELLKDNWDTMEKSI